MARKRVDWGEVVELWEEVWVVAWMVGAEPRVLGVRLRVVASCMRVLHILWTREVMCGVQYSCWVASAQARWRRARVGRS